MGLPALTFRPAEHIRQRRDFTTTYDTGRRVHGRLMTVFVRENAGPVARLGIAATRKIGGAVRRNRAKRQTRALFRTHKPTAAVDVVVVPRREFLDAPYPILEREFLALVDRALQAPRVRTAPGVATRARRRPRPGPHPGV